MKGHFHRLRNDISGFLAGNRNRTLLLFGIEGLLFQFVYSLAAGNGIGTNLYATNLGATDTQVSMVQLLSNLLAVALLLPAGILSDRTKNSKTMPVIILLFVGVMYFFYGTVPVMGEQRMVFFFLFVSLTAGLMAIYNAIWQAFFGDVPPLADRNRVYAFRNRFVFAISTVAPILLGTILTAMPDSERKLSVLRIFFYLCGALNLLNAFVLSRIPGGRRWRRSPSSPFPPLGTCSARSCTTGASCSISGPSCSSTWAGTWTGPCGTSARRSTSA